MGSDGAERKENGSWQKGLFWPALISFPDVFLINETAGREISWEVCACDGTLIAANSSKRGGLNSKRESERGRCSRALKVKKEKEKRERERKKICLECPGSTDFFLSFFFFFLFFVPPFLIWREKRKQGRAYSLLFLAVRFSGTLSFRSFSYPRFPRENERVIAASGRF